MLCSCGTVSVPLGNGDQQLSEAPLQECACASLGSAAVKAPGAGWVHGTSRERSPYTPSSQVLAVGSFKQRLLDEAREGAETGVLLRVEYVGVSVP